MTGLPAARQARMIRRWMVGTCSGGISTPRSPRATITASARATISSSRSTAAGFSSLATRETGRPPAAEPRPDPPAAARRTTPPSRRPARGRRRDRPGPSRSGPRPATRRQPRSPPCGPTAGRPTRPARWRVAPAFSTSSRILPSSSSSCTPGARAAKISGCGNGTRSASPGAWSRSNRRRWPSASRIGPAPAGRRAAWGPADRPEPRSAARPPARRPG